MKKILIILLAVIIVVIVVKNFIGSGQHSVTKILNNGKTYDNIDNVINGHVIEAGYKTADTGDAQRYGKFIIPENFDYYTDTKEDTENSFIDFAISKEFANKELTFIIKAYSFKSLKDNDLEWAAIYYKKLLETKNPEITIEKSNVNVNELNTILLSQSFAQENSRLYIWLFKVEGQDIIKCFSIKCKDYETDIRDKIIKSYTFR